MTTTVTVRLDEEASRALAQLEAHGMSRSEAVRRSLVEAATRRRTRAALAAEAASLSADQADRREMAEVAALMEELRAPW